MPLRLTFAAAAAAAAAHGRPEEKTIIRVPVQQQKVCAERSWAKKASSSFAGSIIKQEPREVEKFNEDAPLRLWGAIR